METIFNNQLKNHLNQNALLPPTQSGYHSSYRCIKTLLDMTDDIIQSTNLNKVTISVLLDFTMNHKVHLKILESMGLCDEAHNLMNSYLFNLFQVVNLNNSFSAVRNLLCSTTTIYFGPLLLTILPSICILITPSFIALFALII